MKYSLAAPANRSCHPSCRAFPPTSRWNAWLPDVVRTELYDAGGCNPGRTTLARSMWQCRSLPNC
eukprot:6209143-Pyramimonas_sp.AAC.1